MARERTTTISVITVFDGKQNQQQAFIELILKKYQEHKENKNIDLISPKTYNYDKVFSDVHVS